MKAAKIVYGLITILLLIPIFVMRGKKINSYMKSSQRSCLIRQVVYLIVTLAIVLSFTISLYRFTIGHEAPLFVEQVSETLISANRNRLNEGDFIELLNRENFATGDMSISGYDDILEKLDFKKAYVAYLSERTYDQEGIETMYCKYVQGDASIYVEVSFSADNSRCQLLSLDVLDENKLEEIDSKMKFLAIK